jgi:hypothetical protein
MKHRMIFRLFHGRSWSEPLLEDCHDLYGRPSLQRNLWNDITVTSHAKKAIGGSQKHQKSKKKPVSLGVDSNLFFRSIASEEPLRPITTDMFHACSMWQPTTEFPKKLGQLSCRFTTVGSLKKPLEAQSFSGSSGSRWSEIAGEENPQLLGSGSFWGWIESPQLKRNIRNSYHLVRNNIAMEWSIHL